MDSQTLLMLPTRERASHSCYCRELRIAARQFGMVRPDKNRIRADCLDHVMYTVMVGVVVLVFCYCYCSYYY